MLRFITVRLGLIVITLLVVSVVIFAVTEMLPGDAAEIVMGRNATEQNLKHMREQLGLDRPAPVRYGDWIWGVVQGDFGESLLQRRPVTEVIGHRLLPSIYLAVFAFVIAVPSAVLVGTMAGVRPNSIGDRIVSTVGMVGISLPEFVTGLLLIIIFSSELGWLPTTSAIPRGESPLTRPEILVLPTLTLTGVVFAYIMRMTRANVLEVMESNYVRTAVLKGLPMRRVILRHVVPNAILPTISIVAAMSGWLLAGLIIVENVFSYPGLGQLLLSSIETRDIPLLQALTLIIAVAYTVSTLLADLSYSFLDPRIRYA
jgi:peptide/nickel transport system permease protein